MGKRAEPAPNGIVTSDSVRAGVVLRKRLLIGLVSLVVLVGLGAGGWYVWSQLSLSRTANPGKTVADFSKLSPAAAIKAAQSDIQTAKTSDEKAAAYSNLGQAYMRDNQTSQAVSAYEQAVAQSSGSSGSSSGSGSGSGSSETVNDVPYLSQLANAYTVAGENDKAIATLQQIITILKASSDPNKDRALSRYQADLQYLQGAP